MDARVDRVRAELRAARLRVAVSLARILEHQSPNRLLRGPVLVAAALAVAVVVACAALQRRTGGHPTS